MTKEQMQQNFLQRYDDIIKSGDTQQMERLGTMTRRVMAWLIKYEPAVAEQALRLLDGDADGYRNHLTEEEAQEIVRRMQPQPTWTFDGLAERLTPIGVPTDCPPYFNHWALFTTMLMIQSDEGETLRKAIGATTKDERLLPLIYKLAVDRMEDADGVFNIRKYFDLPQE